MRTQKRTARWLSVLLVSCVAALAHAAGLPRGAQDSRIAVTAVAGDVAVTMAGRPAAVEPESTVLLPARVVTGNDGTIGLTQAGTHVYVSNDTDVEIPAEAVDGNLIARLVQHRGNVFYDVAPRDVGKLRVETPLLVAVIKGTQFNVAVLEDSTTISLFEGRLEIRTPDGSDVVQLNAGEIAIRSLTDSEIRVVGMNDERVAVPRAAQPAAGAAADDRLAAVRGAVEVANGGALLDDIVAVGGNGVDRSAVKPVVDLGGASADIGLAAGVAVVGTAVDLGLDAGIDLGGGPVGLRLDAGIDLGSAGVDLGAAVVDLNVDAGLDLGTLDLGLDAGLDLGGVVDTSVNAGVDLGSGIVDLGVDLGGALDVGLNLDLGAGTLDLGLTGGAGPPAPAAPPPTPRGGLSGLLGGLL